MVWNVTFLNCPVEKNRGSQKDWDNREFASGGHTEGHWQKEKLSKRLSQEDYVGHQHWLWVN